MPLTTEQSEAFYDRLAEAIDRAGPQGESLFLAKLAMLLAHALGNARAADAAIEQALAQSGSAPPR